MCLIIHRIIKLFAAHFTNICISRWQLVCWQCWYQSVNFGRHLTEILYPFEISYQIFIHTLPYQYLSFRNFTLPKFSFEKSYLTKIFFSEMLRNFTIIKVSVNRLYVNVTLRKLRWRQLAPAVDKRRKTKTKQWLATTKEASHWTYTRINSKLWP